MPSEDRIVIYADGSCLGNPGPGGWGVLLIAPDGSRKELNGHDPTTTNNRMEILAAVEGLRATAPGSSVVLRSDSQYVINTMKLGWKRNKNHDLWKLLDDEQARRRVTFEWVRGHNGDRFNDRADELAVMGSNRKFVGSS
ncbi:MAG TPA: ribonuclease H [Candidatus Binataceae bacterium]|nr:ribonuclease H [Candidatus Binataceae bacterium]